MYAVYLCKINTEHLSAKGAIESRRCLCMCVYLTDFLQTQTKKKKQWCLGVLNMETTKLLSRQMKISENFQAYLQKISSADLLSAK